MNSASKEYSGFCSGPVYRQLRDVFHVAPQMLRELRCHDRFHPQLKTPVRPHLRSTRVTNSQCSHTSIRVGAFFYAPTAQPCFEEIPLTPAEVRAIRQELKAQMADPLSLPALKFFAWPSINQQPVPSSVSQRVGRATDPAPVPSHASSVQPGGFFCPLARPLCFAMPLK